MHKCHPRVHLLSLKDFYIAVFGATKRMENEASPSGPRNTGQMITPGRWITVAGLSLGPGSFLRFSLEFSHVYRSCRSFPNRPVPLLCGAAMCGLQASYGSRNTRANQDRDKSNVAPCHVTPNSLMCGSQMWCFPLDKPCTPFTGLGPWKQALGFSHQAPMLISKSFTNWIYVFWGFLPPFILVCFITASVSSSLVEMSF